MTDQAYPGQPPSGHVPNSFNRDDSVSTNSFFGPPLPGYDPFSEVVSNRSAVGGGVSLQNPSGQLPVGQVPLQLSQGNSDSVPLQPMPPQHFHPSPATIAAQAPPSSANPSTAALFSSSIGLSKEEDFFSLLQPEDTGFLHCSAAVVSDHHQGNPPAPQLPWSREQVHFGVLAERSISNPFSGPSLQDGTSSLSGPLSMPILSPTSALGQPLHGLILQGSQEKSTSAPSTSLITVVSSHGSTHGRKLSFADNIQPYPVETGITSQISGISVTGDTNAYPAEAMAQNLSNTSSAVSSPMSYPPSNVDKNVRNVPFADSAFMYRTNADPEYNTASSRSAPKRPLTNLEFDPDVAKLSTDRSPETETLSDHNVPPTHPVGESPLEKAVSAASMHEDRAPSLSASLNQSLCSLLDNQEDFPFRSSPVRLLAPAPFDIFTSMSHPASVAVVAGKVDSSPLLPPVAVPSIVDSGKLMQTALPDGGSIHNNDVAISTASHSAVTVTEPCGIQSSLGVSSSTGLGVAEGLRDAMVSQEDPSQLPMEGVQHAVVTQSTDILVSNAAVSSQGETERPDSLEDWEIVDHSNSSAIQPAHSSTFEGISATSIPVQYAEFTPSLPSGSVTMATPYAYKSPPQGLAYDGPPPDSSQVQQFAISNTSTLNTSLPAMPPAVTSSSEDLLGSTSTSRMPYPQPLHTVQELSTLQSLSELAAMYSTGSGFDQTSDPNLELASASNLDRISSLSLVSDSPGYALTQVPTVVPGTCTSEMNLPASRVELPASVGPGLEAISTVSNCSPPSSLGLPLDQSNLALSLSESKLDPPLIGSGYDTITAAASIGHATALNHLDPGSINTVSVSTSTNLMASSGVQNTLPSHLVEMQSSAANLPPVPSVGGVITSQSLDSGGFNVCPSLPLPLPPANMTSVSPVHPLQSSDPAPLPAATPQDHLSPAATSRAVAVMNTASSAEQLAYSLHPAQTQSMPATAAAIMPSGMGNGHLDPVPSDAEIPAPAMFRPAPSVVQTESHHVLGTLAHTEVLPPPTSLTPSQSIASFQAVSSDDLLLQAPRVISDAPVSTFAALLPSVHKSTSIDRLRLEQEIATQTSDTNLGRPPATIPEGLRPVTSTAETSAFTEAFQERLATQEGTMEGPTSSHTVGHDSGPPLSQRNESHSKPPPFDVHEQNRGGYDPAKGRDYDYDDSYHHQSYSDPAHSFHSRPHSRASHGYPDHAQQPHAPPLPPHHQDYGPYYPGQPRYDPYYDPHYADPYRHPPPQDPHYDPYGYGMQQPGYYQGYPHDPRYGYQPPPRFAHPSYSHDPYYAGDLYGGTQYPPSQDPYFQGHGDPYQPPNQQFSGNLPHSTVQSLEMENPVEPSVIQGDPSGGFEISQMYPSPSISAPGRPNIPPLESTNLEQTGTALSPHVRQQGGGAQNPVSLFGENRTEYPTEGYQQNTGGYPQGHNHQADQTLESNEAQETWEPIPATPSPPKRTTPFCYHRPHVHATFSFGGQLVTILPADIVSQGVGLIEIQAVHTFLMDDESQRFVSAVSDSIDPFIPRETPKNTVFKFASQQAMQCQEGDVLSDDEDEYMLWEFLKLLCQQNGVIVPSDAADLLMTGKTLAIKPSGPQNMEESLDSLRHLLLSGRKKNALEHACSRGMWGHALMLASRMDDQSRNYVVNRFTASLSSVDPLSTFYTLLLGRTPAAVKQEGFTRAGDWRPHLSMILANKSSKLDNESIVTLGDSLLSMGKVCAAHLCYYLADVHFGSYGDSSSRYSLLGVDPSLNKVGRYPWPQELWKMEVLEYAMSLSRQDFALPSFQVYKLLHILKLVEFGFTHTAMKYCEQISHSVLKKVDRYMPTLLTILLDMSLRLYHFTMECGLIGGDLPSWLNQLDRSVTSILSTDYSPHLSSPSPVFSSVSQTYSSGSARPQLTIGLQQDNDSHLLTVPSQLPALSHTRAGDQGTSYDQDEAGSREGLMTQTGSDLAQVMQSGLTLAAPVELSSEHLVQDVGVAEPGATELQQHQHQFAFQGDFGTNNQEQVAQHMYTEPTSGDPGLGNQNELTHRTLTAEQPYQGQGSDQLTGQVFTQQSGGTQAYETQNLGQTYGVGQRDDQESTSNQQTTFGMQLAQGGNENDNQGYFYGGGSTSSGQVGYAPAQYGGADVTTVATSGGPVGGGVGQPVGQNSEGQFQPGNGEH